MLVLVLRDSLAGQAWRRIGGWSVARWGRGWILLVVVPGAVSRCCSGRWLAIGGAAPMLLVIGYSVPGVDGAVAEARRVLPVSGSSVVTSALPGWG